jgi:uncharacterized protein
MRGILTDDQIEYVLQNEVVGRIGCYSNGKIYLVVPVTYAYRTRYIYVHSDEGMKIKMMRKNPRVCFESDGSHLSSCSIMDANHACDTTPVISKFVHTI